MENLSLNQIFEYVTGNTKLLLAFVVFVAIFLVLIISRTLRKSGLFLLVVTFFLDFLIKNFPIDLYSYFPVLSKIIGLMYIFGLLIFISKIIKRFRRKHDHSQSEHFEEDYPKDEPLKKNSSVSSFLKFTGCIPFLIMLVVSLINGMIDLLPSSLVMSLTALSFLYMAFMTILHIYKKLDNNDSEDNGKMNFKDIKNDLSFKDIKNDLSKDKYKESYARNRNDGRRIKKSNSDSNKAEDEGDFINESDTLDMNPQKKEKPFVNKIKYRDELRYDAKNQEISEKEINDIKKELSNTDLLGMVTKDFDSPLNTTVISIKDLITGEEDSYSSENCIAKIEEDKEYKVDLEFKNFNEYDYGKFLDLLIAYSKNKKRFKFELELIPHNKIDSRIVFYDPSEIFDTSNIFSSNFQSKNISMNFPKYKINFITGN